MDRAERQTGPIKGRGGTPAPGPRRPTGDLTSLQQAYSLFLKNQLFENTVSLFSYYL